MRRATVTSQMWKVIHPSGIFFYIVGETPNCVALSGMNVDGGGIERSAKVEILKRKYDFVLTYDKYEDLKKRSNNFANIRNLNIRGGELELLRLLLGFTLFEIQKKLNIISPQTTKNALLGRSNVALDEIIDFLSTRFYPGMNRDEVIVATKRSPERIRVLSKEMEPIFFALLLTGLLELRGDVISVAVPANRNGAELCEKFIQYIGAPSKRMQKKVIWKKSVLYDYLHSFSPREALSQEIESQRKTVEIIHSLELPVKKQYKWLACALASNVGAEIIETLEGVMFATPPKGIKNVGKPTMIQEKTIATFFELPRWVVLPGFAVE
ncbi:MAG: hypothetical protein QXL15_01125, partial [Candidatus Korarchaeota archaeon]